MTVLLVLFTFSAFLLIDYVRSRNTLAVPTLHVSAAKSDSAVPRLQPALVAGFAVPENLRYHPGHTWALSESTNLVRVGMDDFASKLTGTIETIALPQRGSGFARDRSSAPSIATIAPSIWSRPSKARYPILTKQWRRIPSWRSAILTAKAGW